MTLATATTSIGVRESPAPRMTPLLKNMSERTTTVPMVTRR